MGKLLPLNILPGLYTLDTDREAGAAGRWKDADHVRFWRGAPEKLGGWVKNSTNAFLGKWRGVVDWESLSFVSYIGVGTHLKLYVWSGGVYYDITPIRSSGTLANNPFATTNGSVVVTVTHVAHGATAGSYVTYAGAAAVGGITIAGEYSITSVIGVDSYTITHTLAASSGATGGGAAVTYAYQINIGVDDTIAGLGWGAGLYGGSTYGTPRTTSSFLSASRIWSLDNWGEDMIACPRDGGIYVWDTSVGTGTRASTLGGGPTTAKFILVSNENRQVVAFGVDGDPLRIKWSDAEDYTTWTATSENTAGTKRLDAGNELYCAIKMRGGYLIHTNSWMFLMQFDGPPYNFVFDPRGSNGGIRGPNAAKEYDGRVYWMGREDFFYYDGMLHVLPCDVANHVFEDINTVQSFKVFAGANREFGEIWWLYPSSGSTECDRYVLCNVNEKTWSFGTLARTVYVGDSDTYSGAYAGGADGYLYDHETGVDADGSAMEASLESGDVEIGDGEYSMLVKKLVPDFKLLTGSVTMRLLGRRYPQDTEQITSADLTITSSTKFANPRIECRQISLVVESAEVGDDWRMGTNRIDIKPHRKK